MEKYSTTVIRTEWWSNIKGPKGHYVVEPKNMQGIENECIIYVASARELEDTSPLDVITRARNGLIIVIDCDEPIRNHDDYALWKKIIKEMVFQLIGSNADDRMATIVLAKKTADKSGVHLEENLNEIWKLLGKR